MKRVFCAVVLLCLLTSLFPLCAQADHAEWLTLKALTEWDNYLHRVEDVYGGALWMLSYAEKYAQEPSWENLVYARAALSSAEHRVDQSGFTPSITADELDALQEADVDAYSAYYVMLDWEANRQKAAECLQSFRKLLYRGAFTEEQLNCLAQKTTAWTAYFEEEIAYQALTTNYVLLSLDCEKENFLLNAAEVLPRLSECNLNAFDDVDSLLVAGDNALAAAHRAEMEANRVDFDYDMKPELLWPIKDLSEIVMKDYPTLLPMPGWFKAENMEASYYWYSADGNVIYISLGQKFGTMPARCVLSFSDVTLEEITAYSSRLQELGLVLSEEKAYENSSYEADFALDKGDLHLSWRDDQVFLRMEGSPALFIPTAVSPL